MLPSLFELIDLFLSIILANFLLNFILSKKDALYCSLF